MATDTLPEISNKKTTIIFKETQLETFLGDILRIEIQENWQNYQLATLLTVLEDIYQLFHFLTTFRATREAYLKNPIPNLNYTEINAKLNFSLNEESTMNDVFELYAKIIDDRLKVYDRRDVYAYNFSHKDYFFRVLRLNYNSPGSIDLFGIGKVLEFIRDFVKGIINFVDNRKEKKIKIELLEQDLKKAKIENAQKLIGLAKEMKCDNITLNELIEFVETRQDRLIQLVSSSQIKDIKIIDKEIELEK